MKRTAMDGGLLHAEAAPEWISGEYSYRVLPLAATGIGGMRRLSCALRRRHVAFNFVDHFAANISLPWPAGSCIFSPLSSSRCLVPESLIAMEDHAPIPRLPLSTAVEPGAPMESIAPLGSLELCAQVVSVPEPAALPGCQLVSNLASDDRPIRVTMSRGHAFQLIDGNGRMVRMYADAGSTGDRLLDVRGIPAGLHLLLATTSHGGATQCMKVVVE